MNESRKLKARNSKIRMKLHLWLAKSDEHTMRVLSDYININYTVIRMFATSYRNLGTDNLDKIEKGLNELINKDKQPA